MPATSSELFGLFSWRVCRVGLIQSFVRPRLKKRTRARAGFHFVSFCRVSFDSNESATTAMASSKI